MEAECADVIWLAHYRGVLQAERAGRKQGGEGTGGNRQPLPNMMHETGKVISPNSRLIMFQTAFYRRLSLKALFPNPEASDPMQ